MRTIFTAAATASLLALAACGGGNPEAQKAEEAADNQSDALANQAEALDEMSDDTANGAAAAAMENQADALENASEAKDEMNEQNVVDEAQ